ncbi:MAG: hypothetical protein ACI4CY_05250 [Candidatus Gastranaerophilaceae bacterium]
MANYNNTIPVEVYILTADNDIKGTVHVSEYTNSNRELTDLLNDTGKRFLAVTNAEIIPRNSSAPPRKYDFLEVHMDCIQLVHPSTQVVFKEFAKAQEDIARFRELRQKLNQTKPF